MLSSISRRTLLGYSGTAAAGTVLGVTAPAEAAETAETAETTAASGTAAAPAAPASEFPEGTLFSGRTSLDYAAMAIRFSVEMAETPPDGYAVDPSETADALNELVVSRGWPAITFYGTPKPAPLN
ncbi:hypothetical protein [Streptomyces cellulosae]|uniref:hypothetical protein n=1 Tax=Streptomyces cellulosae TaxID=1968 RepID=UPI00068A2D61|nr:hypothetical protein [Streptomyces cellulosae]